MDITPQVIIYFGKLLQIINSIVYASLLPLESYGGQSNFSQHFREKIVLYKFPTILIA